MYPTAFGTAFQWKIGDCVKISFIAGDSGSGGGIAKSRELVQIQAAKAHHTLQRDERRYHGCPHIDFFIPWDGQSMPRAICHDAGRLIKTLRW
jgi:hypothetical protein